MYGSVGDGFFGVPVAGGLDCDGDEHADYALSAMRASPDGRKGAGEVFLVFGDGTIRGVVDTAEPRADVLVLWGDGNVSDPPDRGEAAGNEIWIDDVTGDGVGDLLVARQNHRPTSGRDGAGALSIVVGGPELRALAERLEPLDLRAPAAGVRVTTLVGAQALGRLGIWVRTGDVTGDRIPDVLVGADQEGVPDQPHHGAVYLVRGGPHLAAGGVIDLAGFGSTPLAGHIARVTPPPGAAELHFGATCQLADLDGDGAAELLAAAALARMGASITAVGAPSNSAHSTGGTPDGTLWIAWGDNFADPWPPGFQFSLDQAPGTVSRIDGGAANLSFGEEILGGFDWDADGAPDLFVGDLEGGGSGGIFSGLGHVLYDASRLAGEDFDLDAPPPGLRVTTFLGAAASDITADTALAGDFDGDGISDLAFSAPHAGPSDRRDAGVVYVFHGRSGGWPAEVELGLEELPGPEVARVSALLGAKAGDVLAYSADAGDLDSDGLTDLILNEMLGDGLAPGTVNVGNLIVVSGRVTAPEPGVPGSVAALLVVACVSYARRLRDESEKSAKPTDALAEATNSRSATCRSRFD